MKTLIFISLVILNFVYLENIPDAVYDGNKLTYSILFNLTEYLNTLSENKSEIEEKKQSILLNMIYQVKKEE